VRLNIEYNRSTVPLEVDDARVAQVVGLNHVQVGDETSTLRNAFENPLNSRPFSAFIHDAKNILFIVNDGTRPTPTAKILESLHDEISTVKNPRFLIATGSHRAANEEECNRIFGSHFHGQYADRIKSHDAIKDEIVELGVTSYGTPVRLNRIAHDAARLVVISSVEPHYFGGYTGGRKSIFPGVAGYDTIEQNHSLAMRPGVAPLALKGNAVHEDLVESMKFIHGTPIFSIQTVLSHDGRIYAVTAGDIHESFNAAVAKAHEVFAVPIKEKAEIVLSVATFPLDANLLQLQKALNNAKAALKDDGILILVGACPEGIGDGNFYELMEWARDPFKARNAAKWDYKLGNHIAYNMADIAIRYGIFSVTGLPDDVARTAFMTPAPSVQDAVDWAFGVKGKDAKILILTNGSLTVPYVRG